MTTDQPEVRPTGWQAEHAKKYIATDGEDGHIWNGVPTLLLTTTGRRSREARTTPLNLRSRWRPLPRRRLAWRCRPAP